MHACGRHREGDRTARSAEADLLRDCYLNSLALALEHGAKTVVFPNISTGIYGYPKAEACGVAVAAVREFCQKNDAPEVVRFICFDTENLALYRQALEMD